MMRVAVLAAILVLSACATNGLSLAPPKEVNFSGHWELNVADSDDPQHILQTANAQAAAAGDQSGGRSGGRSSGGGRGRGAGSPYGGGAMPPPPPSVAILNDAFQWPGNKMDVKQVAGVVAFTTDGVNRLCTPSTAEKKSHRHDDEHRPSGRDLPPLACGWIDRTLIVLGGDDSDRTPYESSFSVSDDGKRLVEMVSFKGGRSNGFTLSRVWDLKP
jgi:hypothetical protein